MTRLNSHSVLGAVLLVFSALYFSLISSPAAAQPHPGGVLIGGGYPSNSTSYLNGLYRVSKTGQLSTFVDTFAPQRPYYFQETEMGMDNRSIVFGTNGSSSAVYNLTYGVFRYDPATMKYTTLARSTLNFRTIYGIEANQDGNWLIAATGRDINNATTYGIYEVRNDGSGYSTVLTTLALGHRQTFNQPLHRDVDSGDLLIPSSTSVGFFTRPVYALANDGTVSTWNTSSAGPSPTYGFDQDIASGDIMYMTASSAYRCAKGRTGTTSKYVPGLSPRTAYASVMENQSAPNREMIVYAYRQSASVTEAEATYIDPVAGTIYRTVNFLRATSRVQIPYPLKPMLNDQDRYIQTVKTTAKSWDLLLDMPAFANKAYAVGAGFSGVRPGLKLGGRHIWLNFDQLVLLTLTNSIAVVFNPGPLTLDAQGRAKGKINLQFFPLPLGITIHMVAAVLDPAAPSGIAFITEPCPMNL